MQIGDQMQVKAYKSDGTCYRWWQATVEAIEENLIITIAPAGKRVEAIDGGWVSTGAIRTFYWLHKPYSLLEVYTPGGELGDGELNEIYVNINSLVQIEPGQLSYVDYELDVTLRPPDAARIVDQDEFAEAIILYGYTVEFQQFCYQAAEEALHLANGWVAKGMFVL
jgi:protein associated with RNAse G/E